MCSYADFELLNNIEKTSYIHELWYIADKST